MPPSKIAHLRQYRLLNSDLDDLDSTSTSSDLPARNYLNYHYKYHCLAFTFFTLATFYLAFNFLELYSIWTSTHLHTLLNHSNDSAESAVDYSKYLIYTPQCIIPLIPVFTNETRPLYSAYSSKEYTCPKPDATAAIRRVNATWISIPEGLNCSAREIIREPVSESWDWGRSFNFGEQTLVNFNDTDAVEVSCIGIKPKKVIPLIPVKKPIWANASQSLPDLTNHTNILAIGIDSISRLNYMRHFNECQQFVAEQHFEGPLFGHHKVGDNTFPNLIGMFTGNNSNLLLEQLPASRKLDAFNLIFKHFSAKGYMNTYIENMPRFGLWTYHKKSGFTKQPLEYWIRPTNLVIYKELKNWYCYKDKLEMEYYYDYVYDQMQAFRQRSQRFLTFIHMGAVTHDYLNYAQYADLPMSRFMKRIFEANLHNDTLIIFYSDHGIRFGKIMKTASGYHESRMPFMYFHIPKGLRLKNGKGVWMDSEAIRRIIRINSRRLTSQYDVHATLRHLLDLAPPEGELFGRSLFDIIPRNRSCEQAGIPEEYCLCKTYVPFNDSQSLSLLSKFFVDHLNRQLKPFSAKCASLSLDRILSARISYTDSKKNEATFSLKILTKPNNGTLETTLQAEMNNGTVASGKSGSSIKLAGSIIRLDRYGDQSKCVYNAPVESYCYCKELLKKG